MSLFRYVPTEPCANQHPSLPSCFLHVCWYNYVEIHGVNNSNAHNSKFCHICIKGGSKIYISVHLSPLTLISAANISITVVIIIIRVITRNTQYTHIRQYISGIKKMKSNYTVMLYKDAVKTWKK